MKYYVYQIQQGQRSYHYLTATEYNNYWDNGAWGSSSIVAERPDDYATNNTLRALRQNSDASGDLDSINLLCALEVHSKIEMQYLDLLIQGEEDAIINYVTDERHQGTVQKFIDQFSQYLKADQLMQMLPSVFAHATFDIQIKHNKASKDLVFESLHVARQLQKINTLPEISEWFDKMQAAKQLATHRHPFWDKVRGKQYTRSQQALVESTLQHIEDMILNGEGGYLTVKSNELAAFKQSSLYKMAGSLYQSRLAVITSNIMSDTAVEPSAPLLTNRE